MGSMRTHYTKIFKAESETWRVAARPTVRRGMLTYIDEVMTDAATTRFGCRQKGLA